MRKNILYLLIYLLIIIGSNAVNAQDPVFNWMKKGGSAGRDYGKDIAIDSYDNTYLLGQTLGKGFFFIHKYNSNGTYLWSRQIGFSALFVEHIGHALAVDPITESIYITGEFNGTCDFDPGLGTFNLVSNGNNDVFILKLDNNGDFVWAKSFGGTNFDIGKSIEFDENGYLYLTGTFIDTVNITTNSGVKTLISNGSHDCFVTKLDTLGDFIWANSFGGTYEDNANFIKIDDAQNIYLTGWYQNTVDFDPGSGIFNLSSNAGYDLFLLKLDKSGDFIWAKSIGGVGNDYGYSMDIDTNNNIFLSGSFSYTVDLDPNAGVNNITSIGEDMFIEKLDSSGTFIWVKNLAANFNSAKGVGRSISLDKFGNIYLAGRFQGPIDFDPGPGTQIHAVTTLGNAFMLKLDINGNYVWKAFFVSSNYEIVANNIIVNSVGNVLVTGFYDLMSALLIGSWSQQQPNTSNQEEYYLLNLKESCFLSSTYSYINNGNGNYSFTNNSSGNFNKTHWAFGDGNRSLVSNPTHTFATNGLFEVVLTIGDSSSPMLSNCFDYFKTSLNVTGVVNPLVCHSGFVMYPDTQINNVAIFNSSTGNNLSYLWDFGDGDTSTLASPTHVYAGNGPYYLCLTVDDGNSCIDMYCDSIGPNGAVFKQSGFTINITTLNTTSVNSLELLDNGSVIYPNPVLDILYLTTEIKINEAYIFDIAGKLVKEIEKVTNSITVSDLQNGIYFIKISTDEAVFTKKFIKQ